MYNLDMLIKPNDTKPLNEYPNKIFERENVKCLNGNWDYAILKSFDLQRVLKGDIIVPFCVESHTSLVNKTLHKNEYLHLRTTFHITKRDLKGRILLNIGACDQRARIFINRKMVTQWTFPYLPLNVDITRFLKPNEENELYIICMDDTENEFIERGYQSLKPKGQFHSSVSGIWQSVFLESVPENYVKSIRLESNFDSKLINFSLQTVGKIEKIAIDIFDDDEKLVTLNVKDNKASYMFTSFKAWTPKNPHLYKIIIKTKHETINSYFAMRKFSKSKIDGKEIFMLNNEPYLIQGVSVKGYFGDTRYTPYSYDEYKKDILSAKSFGFNTLRVEGKFESPMFYYLCDSLGILVIQDFPCGGDKYHKLVIENKLSLNFDDTNYGYFSRVSEKGRDHFYQSMIQGARLFYNHPSIFMWTIFDEGKGQFDTERLTHDLRGVDKTRLIDSASGWYDQGQGDINSIHERIKKNKVINDNNRILMLTKCGNYSLYLSDYCKGKDVVTKNSVFTKDEFTDKIVNLMKFIIEPAIIGEGLSGYVFGQLYDVEEEYTGLLTYNRKYIKCDYNKVKDGNIELKKLFDRTNKF